MSEPIRHHYIPQFILKNFCSSKDGYLFYFDKGIGKVVLKNKSEIFVTPNLYKDEVNNDGDPQQIEKDLAKFEGEVALLVKRMLTGDQIEMTEDEIDSLKLFFAIMPFRSKRTFLQFKNMSEESTDFYATYQPNRDLGDFWKRNLGALAKCRRYQEVVNNDLIDFPIKIFMFRDTQGLVGMYPIIIEKRGGTDFLIGDVYPTIQTGSLDNGGEIPMYSFYPLSPNRMLVLAADGVILSPLKIRLFSESVLRLPILKADNETVVLRVRKIYEPTVKELNDIVIENYAEGFAMFNPSKCNF